LTKVLVIEDDEQTASELIVQLESRGYDVHCVRDGDEGIDRSRADQWDVLIVDRMLPKVDGLTLLRRLREDGDTTPALVLSALSAIDDKIIGLRAGADDYLSKPFSMEELSARLEALLRRPCRNPVTIRRVGPLELDLIRREARRGQRQLDLLAREFQLLDYMMSREGQVITRAMLLEDVWHYRFVPKTNLVDVHMGRLRRKVDSGGEPPLISSVRQAGFILRAPV